MTFNVGDWVLCRHAVQMVKETENQNVTCVTDGHFSLHSNNIQCWPMILELKHWADHVEHYANEVHKLKNNRDLNHPDIAAWFNQTFDEGCERWRMKKDFGHFYDDVTEFFQEIKKQVEQRSDITLKGIKLFDR